MKNKQFLTLNLNIFCHEKISLSGTPISLPKTADLPIWAQENITCMKIGQGQTRVIIWTNVVELEHPMLHTKFQGHRPFGSGKEDFLSFLPYTCMGMAAILVMWPWPFEQTFVPPFQGGSIWNLVWIGPVVSEKMFENVDIQYTHIPIHIRTTGAYLYYKLTNEPKGSGELKIVYFLSFYWIWVLINPHSTNTSLIQHPIQIF